MKNLCIRVDYQHSPVNGAKCALVGQAYPCMRATSTARIVFKGFRGGLAGQDRSGLPGMATGKVDLLRPDSHRYLGLVLSEIHSGIGRRDAAFPERLNLQRELDHHGLCHLCATTDRRGLVLDDGG